MEKLSSTAKKRLTRLIEFMEKMPKTSAKHFSMDSWFSHEGKHVLTLGKGDSVTLKTMEDCGTTACAAGWAGTMPYFQRLGLVTNKHGLRWKDYTLYGSRDVAQAFDISPDQSSELFHSRNEDKTPHEWAKRAKKLMREWERG